MENSNQFSSAELPANKEKIVNTLRKYGIEVKRIEVTPGPSVSLYEIVPKPGENISKIKDLEIMESMFSFSAKGNRIIKSSLGKDAFGIEVPNGNPKIISLQSILNSDEFKNSSFELPIVLGETYDNKNVITDLAKLPHLLVGGATGQGKSDFLHAIINSLLNKKHPEELKLVLIDTKNKQFSIYAELKNRFLASLFNGESAVISNTKKVIETLNSLSIEMFNRYELLNQNQVNNLIEYNQLGKKNLAYLVIVIDEIADLLAIAAENVQTPITNLIKLGQSVGIHLIISTQRPSANKIFQALKANFSARVAFRVSSVIDSNNILDTPGANQLLGRGDMLFSQGKKLVRIQSAIIDTPEIEKLVKSICEQTDVIKTFILPENNENPSNIKKSDLDPLFDEASDWAKPKKQVSIDQIKRKFAVGHIRAGRILEQLKVTGIVK